MSGYFVHGGTQYPGSSNQATTQADQYGNTFGMGLYDSHTEQKSIYPFQNQEVSTNFSTSSANQSLIGTTNPDKQQYNIPTSYSLKSEPQTSNFGNTSQQSPYLNNLTSTFRQSAFSQNFNSKPNVYELKSNPYSQYEKALQNAANTFYQNKNRGGISRGGGRGRPRGGGLGSRSHTPSTPKPIRATEIKAYVYAWSGQRQLKPEYEVKSCAVGPKPQFECTLRIKGLEYVATVTAGSKKIAQSKAAWDFAENLVKQGYMKQSELPDKPIEISERSTPPEPTTPVGVNQSEATMIENTGGWTLENCRQRLNQFWLRERIAAEFKHETFGPEHSRTFIAFLETKIPWIENKVFTAKESGKNKKQATALCALSMIRQLYKEGIIEKQGDPIKVRGKVLRDENKMDDKKTPSLKRKADDITIEVDEKGNWTVDNSRQRLHQFCKAKHKPFKIDLEEKQLSPNKKVYIASMTLDVIVDGEEKKLDSSQTANSKKSASQQCALELITQLYALKLVEPNLPTEKKKNQRRSFDSLPYNMPPYGFPEASYFGSPYHGFPVAYGAPFYPKRTTGITEVIVGEKHKRIYPEEQHLNNIQDVVLCIERGLKSVADKIAETNDDENSDEDNKWLLQGVMRVGRLSKGLLLRDDKEVDLVLLCTEKPTTVMLSTVLDLLEKHLETDTAASKFNLSLKPDVDAAKIIVNAEPKTENEEMIIINVHVTSTTLRNPLDDTKDPDIMLDRECCLKSLAELRHAKWFQACCKILPGCLVTLRLLLDIKRRLPPWECLTDWMIELIVEKSLVTSPMPLSEGDAFRRVFSCLSSGILLPGGPGLLDPCEKDEIDVLEVLKAQQKQDITELAQHAMRLIVYRQAYKVLGIEPPPAHKRDSRPASSTTAEENEATSVDMGSTED